MTVTRLRREMSAAEYAQWAAYTRVQAVIEEEARKRAEREAKR